MICPKCSGRLVPIMQPVRILGRQVSRRRLLACMRCRVVVRLQRMPKEYDKQSRVDLVRQRARAVLGLTAPAPGGTR